MISKYLFDIIYSKSNFIRLQQARLVQSLIKACLFYIVLLITFSFANCKEKKKTEPPKNLRPEVLEEGLRIKFDPSSPGLTQIKVSKFGIGGGFVTLNAPGRVIATISHSVRDNNRIVLFESPEINAMYASYLMNRTALNRSTKNLRRVKDMFKSLVATEKDVIDAEAEVNSTQAEVAEFEGKLRALGFNPSELQYVKTDIIWMICDVPEVNLNVVKNEKEVEVYFSSFPDKKFVGKVDAIGDNVDPLTRTVKVRVSLPNKNNQFKPGMFAKVEFGNEAEDTPILPFTSVITVEGKTYVFVQQQPGEFIRRPVVLGNSGSDNVSIIQGLTAGEEVVVGGAVLLKGLSFGY